MPTTVQAARTDLLAEHARLSALILQQEHAQAAAAATIAFLSAQRRRISEQLEDEALNGPPTGAGPR